MLNYHLKLFSYTKLFDELVALEKRSKLPSRILFTGQKGIGKNTFALHFINYLLSRNEANKYNIENNQINIDNKSYNLLKNLTHPNFFMISNREGKKNIEIDQIRNMINFLNKSSFNDHKKIILIDGAENLNINSSNALLKSLEDSSSKNLFLLTHNVNKNIAETIKSRCINYHLNFDYVQINNLIKDYFKDDSYQNLHDDFKFFFSTPFFIINHIYFLRENNLKLNLLDIKTAIQFIIDNKSYKKNEFIFNNFQSYIEIYFTKMYLTSKDSKYYDIFLKIISENNQINKFNLDLDSFFIKYEHKYLNI